MKDNKVSFKNLFLTLLGISMFSLLIIYGCRKDPKPNSDEEKITLAKGFGDSIEEPEGTAFLLPGGITLISPSYTYKTYDKTDCNGDLRKDFGEAELVPLCLLFSNNNNQPVDIELPPGLIFVCAKNSVQNGIIIQKILFTIPANKTLYVPVPAYCLNGNRSTPELGSDDKYKVGPITRYEPMLELIKKLETKKLITGDTEQNKIITTKVQDLVWQIAHIGKLDDKGIEILNSIPNK